MRIFVTGSTGYIGNAVARAFRARGHVVHGLVRTAESAKKLSTQEIIPVIGDIKTPQSYFEVLKNCQILVHTAFERSPDGIEQDMRMISTLIDAAQQAKLSRTIIYTSGCWIHGNTNGAIVDEASPVHPLNLVAFRPLHEEKILRATTDLVRTVIIRPGCVFGGSGSLTGLFFEPISKNKPTVIGDGQNYWSMIHVDDLASAYVLAAEKECSRAIFNVNNGVYHTVGQMVEACAKALGVTEKITYQSYEEAKKTLGSLAEGLTANQKIANGRAKALLDWQPLRIPFMDDIQCYFETWKSNMTHLNK